MMLRHWRRAAAALITIFAVAVAAAAVRADDHDVLFGHRDLELGIDRQAIPVAPDLGKFQRIRLKVIGHDIHVVSLRIAFTDGSHQEIPIDAEIKSGSRSDWLAVDDAKFMHEVQLTYRAQPGNRELTRIEVTGEYPKGWLMAVGEGRKYHDGWVLLGAQTASFSGFDRDTIRVGENEGGFARLRIEAVDRAITLKEIRVKFADGPDEIFAMRERIDPGKPYGPLEFKSGRAPIKSIEAVYRSRFDMGKGLKKAFDGRAAVVQIWGQH
jgi:hypothetical protein